MSSDHWDVQDELTALMRREGDLLEKLETERCLVREARGELDRLVSENQKMRGVLTRLRELMTGPHEPDWCDVADLVDSGLGLERG